MSISKTDNGQCWEMERPRVNRLTREVDNLLSHIPRWISSDRNSVELELPGEHESRKECRIDPDMKR
jgi:hypothetical protein